MADIPRPYTPHVAFAMDDFKTFAKIARMEAEKLLTKAEVWEEAARKLESAIEKERAQQGPTPAERG